MKMARCTAAILLMLSLEALVAGRLSAAVADDGVDTIRLPSHGLADELVTAVATENGDDTKRPLKFPPCGECPYPTECSRGHCEVIMTNHGGGDDGQPGADPGLAGPDEATVDAVSTMNVNDDGEEETRPWKCCDLARCTRSMPPTCQCMDKVKKCAKTCKSCEKVEGSSRYVCLDSYRGNQGPACTPGPPPPPTFTPRSN